jgi:hypothetical protein
MIDHYELDLIKQFVRGLVAGITDTHTNPDLILEDYWYAWDETLDINIWIDESHPQRYLATLYRVVDDVRDDETFQRLDYL